MCCCYCVHGTRGGCEALLRLSARAAAGSGGERVRWRSVCALRLGVRCAGGGAGRHGGEVLARGARQPVRETGAVRVAWWRARREAEMGGGTAAGPGRGAGAWEEARGS
jgi:hypothetical protein